MTSQQAAYAERSIQAGYAVMVWFRDEDLMVQAATDHGVQTYQNGFFGRANRRNRLVCVIRPKAS